MPLLLRQGLLALALCLAAAAVRDPGYTSLHLAAQSNDEVQAAHALSQSPALLNARGALDDATALMLAAEEGHLELVQLLLAHGADVNASVRDGRDGDLDGATALMWAAAAALCATPQAMPGSVMHSSHSVSALSREAATLALRKSSGWRSSSAARRPRS